MTEQNSVFISGDHPIPTTPSGLRVGVELCRFWLGVTDDPNERRVWSLNQLASYFTGDEFQRRVDMGLVLIEFGGAHAESMTNKYLDRSRSQTVDLSQVCGKVTACHLTCDETGNYAYLYGNIQPFGPKAEKLSAFDDVDGMFRFRGLTIENSRDRCVERNFGERAAQCVLTDLVALDFVGLKRQPPVHERGPSMANELYENVLLQTIDPISFHRVKLCRFYVGSRLPDGSSDVCRRYDRRQLIDYFNSPVFGAKVDNGMLQSEFMQPTPAMVELGMRNPDNANIAPYRVCGVFTRIDWVVEGDYLHLIGDVRPAGPFGHLLTEDQLHDFSFRHRAMTYENENGVTVLKSLIAVDWNADERFDADGVLLPVTMEHYDDVWRPIDTAPRDGTTILVAFGQDGESQARYIDGKGFDIEHPWMIVDSNGGDEWIINFAVDGPGGPSFWRPFPRWVRPNNEPEGTVNKRPQDEEDEVDEEDSEWIQGADADHRAFPANNEAEQIDDGLTDTDVDSN